MRCDLAGLGVLVAWLLASAGGCRSGDPDLPVLDPYVGLDGEIVLRLRNTVEVSRLGPDVRGASGPGAEARPGDILLENSMARFVVGAGTRRDPSPAYAGALIDASLQGAPDYLRAFAPGMGDDLESSIHVTSVELLATPGQDGSRSVVVLGAWTEDARVSVETTYVLVPDSPAIDITTRVANGSDRDIRQPLGDCLLYGRTERFVEGVGLHPAGKAGESRWMCFWAGRSVCLLHGSEQKPFVGRHERGRSRLVFARPTIAPGASAEYTRRLVLADEVADGVLVAPPVSEGTETGVLSVQLRDADGLPLAGCVEFFRSDGRPAGIAVAGPDGWASTRLAAASYTMTCRARGRESLTRPAPVRSGMTQRAQVDFGAPSRVKVSVREDIGGVTFPAFARLTFYPLSPRTPPFAGGPDHSLSGDPSTWLVPPGGELDVELPGGGPNSSEYNYGMLVTRGPLYQAMLGAVAVRQGEEKELRVVVQQVIEPGEYAAIDFGQFMEIAPESSATLEERTNLNACEGLDGAVVLRGWPTVSVPSPVGVFAPPLVGGVRLHTAGVGTVTVLDGLERSEAAVEKLPAPAAWEPDAAGALGLLRGFFPLSLIQIEDAAAGGSGVSARNGGGGDSEDGGSVPDAFDTIGLLSGGDTLAARRTLPGWFRLLNMGRRVIVTGGSNSVGIADRAGLGARTYVRCPRAGERPTGEELKAALRDMARQPDAFVTNGPFIKVTVDGASIGSMVRPAGDAVEMKLRVEAAQWLSLARVRVVRGGQTVRTFDLSGRSEVIALDETLALDAGEDTWFVVVVEGDRGMAPAYVSDENVGTVPFAVTNPFWIDADGDGLCIPRAQAGER